MSDMNDFPSPGLCYQDERGVRVTVVNVDDRCVVFMREEYPYPCMRPVYNFLAKFRKITEEKSSCAADLLDG
ncbi:TPA: DUF4222 domain-containing protein [Salmonella enterica subsp. enterica serovar Saintpaul str. CFSAN004144]|nr:DUF4222 domain-containing protein [Salmonella enterica subsp. enterica serovar Saintpaul str. CFSAN004144]